MTAISAREVRRGWPWAARFGGVLRRLAIATTAGALSGLLVGGIGGRLAMMLLARLAPETTGVVSDDGFVMGQLTLSGTLNLAVANIFIGVVGAGVYVFVRGLMLGPRWFQVLSISLGSAVVVGGLLVHPSGVDFTLLHPTWLAIALFVAIPGLYGALLTILTERWLAPDGRFQRARLPVALAPLALWLPLAPALLIGLLGWFAVEVLRSRESTRALVEHPLAPWLARLSLTIIFVVSLTGLIQDTADLT